MQEKIKDACNKELIKRRQIEDRRTKDNEEENDEEMQLIREEFLLPEGLLEETEMF